MDQVKSGEHWGTGCIISRINQPLRLEWSHLYSTSYNGRIAQYPPLKTFIVQSSRHLNSRGSWSRGIEMATVTQNINYLSGGLIVIQLVQEKTGGLFSTTFQVGDIRLV